MSEKDGLITAKQAEAFARQAQSREVDRQAALRLERNYQVLQAAAVIYGAALQAGLDEEQVKKQKRPFEVFVAEALALLEEIEKRNP